MSKERVYRFFWGEKADTYAWRLWLLFFAVIAFLAFFQPAKRNITHHYNQAARDWWKGEDMYSLKGAGFLYFPQSVLVYTPFAWQDFPEDREEFNRQPLSETLLPTLPLRIAETLYRAFALGLFAWAIWRMCERFKPDARTLSLFALVTVLTIPASTTAGRNGQFNMLLSASMILAAVEISDRRWWLATAWLILGVMIKPLGMVPLLLFGALYRPLWWRLPVGFAAFFALSFVHYDPAYVVRQWEMCIEQVRTASLPPSNHFDDIAAMFRTFGLNFPDAAWFPVRALFAPLTLLLAWRLTRIYPPRMAAFLVAAAAAVYLMLFNPRNETNSFLILSPYIALFAAVICREKGRGRLFWLLAFLCIGFGSDTYGDIYKVTKIWFKPLLACVFFGVLTSWAIRRQEILFAAKSAPASDYAERKIK
ncbi:glycosyltransferase family 87 protein [Kamptonema cortianum]|uniref:Glycosyltransferase family 87 protein n=1 Tax=Geitlerinema calcuttense NRMC-F 0142 TaxID=2922238 RepID=A0ABT7LX63_9CYAN|nr:MULTISPECIES: glycosyltransferase family 87 protein [Cyanophyceae]MDK3156635.1 glycosyltransferase family 87 protein [Kamptonema cortianum]MDL5050354.1 glycosyltransferase family 87 protein [Oscillatoria amoena NRMC-F 0135]MDL5053374.1 glycosyltransferase family 87 protein [Oscillatoria laete-virens NRMC-F 0139]MDL5056593.1 glycosyltransferase family 87 protein [Geitlerinema calcuttense NRMC-F 0142]